MDELNVQVSLYNRHRNGRYSSYKGTVGKVARNVLHQHFNETVPFKVLHTDVTQVRLANTKWAYVSAITDEASKEVLAFQVSNSPNGKLIMDTLDELSEKNLYKACLVRETVLIMRQLKASFIFLKQNVLMDFHSVKILENSRKSQRITSIGLTIDEYHRKQKA